MLLFVKNENPKLLPNVNINIHVYTNKNQMSLTKSILSLKCVLHFFAIDILCIAENKFMKSRFLLLLNL